jgi:DeoR family myo-inositol catabolism operon transcriptional repressor
MEDYIVKKETVSMEELQQKFLTSLNTVRRDVALLLKKGTVEKVYGGVRARKPEQLAPFDVRTIKNQEAKMAIGRKAAEFVEEGDIIFLDSGTTTLHVVQNLAQKQNITIITHSLNAIMASMSHPNLTIISLPGQLHRKTSSFTGLDAVRFLKSYNIKKAFMAATGLSISHGVTNSSPLEYELKMTAMERSAQSYLLLDSQKFGQTALLTYASLDRFDGIITESMPDGSYVKALEAVGTKLILA